MPDISAEQVPSFLLGPRTGSKVDRPPKNVFRGIKAVRKWTNGAGNEARQPWTEARANPGPFFGDARPTEEGGPRDRGGRSGE